jgi:predicted phage terminase large subunit-like protein
MTTDLWSRIDQLPAKRQARVLELLDDGIGPLRLPFAGPVEDPFTPTVKQEAFLRLNSREVFYGGAAGPGKSTALLMGALQYVDVPGYSAILFRRTYPELMLPGGLVPMSKEWLAGTSAVYNEGHHRWTFSSGATLTFAHMQRTEDRLDYQGAAFQFIGFDELTTFDREQYVYLFARCRRPKRRVNFGRSPDGTTLADVPLRVRSASNPGGPGHEWVKTRLVDRKTRRKGSRFVRARPEENPHLDWPTYLENLSELSPVDQARLISGDWDVQEQGTTFRREWFKVVEEAPPATNRWRIWDLAATEPTRENPDPDYTVGMLLSWSDTARRFTIEEIVRERVGPGKVKRLIAATASRDGHRTRIHLEQEPGASGKMAIEDMVVALRGYVVKTERPTGSKTVRARPAAAAAENGLIQIVRGEWLEPFLAEAAGFPVGHDDQIDTLSAGIGRLRVRGRSKSKRPVGQVARR